MTRPIAEVKEKMALAAQGLKHCRPCARDLSVEMFGKNRAETDGLQRWCKGCRRGWLVEHADRVSEQKHESHLRTYSPERAKARYQRNRDVIRERQREYAARTAERNVERVRAWVAANPERARVLRRDANRRRRARRLGLVVVRYRRLDIYERDGGRCHICKQAVPKDRFTLDHLIPWSQGGPDSPENVAVAHQSCNARRGPGRLPAQLRLVG